MREPGYYFAKPAITWKPFFFDGVNWWFGEQVISENNLGFIYNYPINAPDETGINEYTRKRIRSLASSLELQEFKHEDTGEMFDIDSCLLDRL